MRLLSTTIALAALLFSGAAGAAGTDKESGKGAAGPAAPPADNSPGGGKADDQLSEVRDTRGADTTVTPKAWEVGAGVEYHHLVDPEAVDNGAARNVEYYSLFGRWDLTPYDRVSVRWGLYQFALVDQGDSPVRSDDISASYTRRIPLPGQVILRATASLTAPISYGSQVATLITSPRVSLQVDRKFGHLTLDGRLGGTVFIFRDAEGGGFTGGGIAGNSTPSTGPGGNGPGASPNPKGSLTMVISADFSMPFHEALGVGLSIYNGYSWVYNVGCSGSGSLPSDTGIGSATGMPGSTMCMPTTNASQSQPMFQAWGGEVNVHYTLPNFGGFKSDLLAAFAPNGDPTIGYNSTTHGTGLGQFDPFYYRQTAEVYFGLTGRY